MLERHDSLEPGRIYNLAPGKLVDFLLEKKRAVIFDPGKDAESDVKDRQLPGLVLSHNMLTEPLSRFIK